MKLRIPFLKKTENEPLAPAEKSANEKTGETPDQVDPVSVLSKKISELEVKVVESERARQDENLELRRRLEEVNRANRESSAGSVRGVQSDYFSYNEVKEMTPAQVRKNFSRIVDSMGKWN